MEKDVFEFKSYRAYLESRVGSYRQRRGLKSKMAEAMGTQPTFVTQILNGSVNISLEQAYRLNNFFEHTGEEADFFLLLVQKDRAGSSDLQGYFQSKLDEIRTRRQVLTHRLGLEQTLSKQNQGIYYSTWHYAALHIAVAIPALQTREALATYFRLPIKKVSEVLDVLVSMGVVKLEQGRLAIGPTRVRLGNDSFNIIKHHSNWRGQAIESFDREEATDLHYSGVLCLSQSDAQKIKELIFESLRTHLEISDASPEEELFSYCIDFFHLRK